MSRGWWKQLPYTSLIGSAKNFFKLVSRKNTLSQARRNISRHYDLVSWQMLYLFEESKTTSMIKKQQLMFQHMLDL